MKGLIIVNAYSKNEIMLNQPLRLKEELFKLGVKTEIIPMSVSLTGISGEEIRSSFNGCDFCVFYDKDRYALMEIEKAGIRCFNNYRAMTLCDDKMLTFIALSGADIPMPETYSSPLCYTPSSSATDEYFDFLEKKLGFPMIVKECYGSLGKGVRLATNKDELKHFSEELKLKPHIYQKFVAESFGTDLRVIVIGGKYVGAMKRTSFDDFRSNIAAGGKGETYAADERTIALSEKIAKLLGLDYCGIDFLFGKDGLVLCEVNSNAFFKEFEKTTGINVAELYAKHIISAVKNK